MSASNTNFCAILAHTGQSETPDHWDLLIELDNTAEKIPCWQLDANPLTLTEGQRCSARRIFDHRRKYLSYSGPVGNQRGEVELIHNGELAELQYDSETGLVKFALLLDGQPKKFEIATDPERSQTHLTRTA